MSNRKEFTLEELDWKLVLLKREFARLLTSGTTEERLDECYEHMASLGEWIDDRRALVIAYVDGAPTKSPPPYEDIEAEEHRRAQDNSEALRELSDLERCLETGEW